MENLLIKLTLIALTFINIESTELFGKDATEKFPGMCLLTKLFCFSGSLSMTMITTIKRNESHLIVNICF